MFKQIISFFVVIALSAAVVFFMPEAQKVVHALVSAHSWVSEILTSVFNGGHAGSIARELVALLAIPLIAGLIPGILFFLLRKYWLPCFMEIVWIVWLLQAGALLVNYVYAAGEPTAQTEAAASEPTQKADEPAAAAPPAVAEETHEPAPEPAAE